MKSGNRRKKAAIELSINTLVIIIISLFILGSGIVLLYKFIDYGGKAKIDLDLRTKAEIERIIVNVGKKLALPFNSAQLHPGESYIFGLGILNVDKTEESFKIRVTLSSAMNEKNEEITSQMINEVETWLLYVQDPVQVKIGEYHSEPIMVELPNTAPKGTYNFNVDVYSPPDELASNHYYNTQKIHVVVS